MPAMGGQQNAKFTLQKETDSCLLASNTGRPYQKDFVLESGFIRRKLLFKNILSISLYEKALLLGLKTGKLYFPAFSLHKTRAM